MTQVSWSLSHVLELLVLEDWTLSSAEKALLVPNGPSPGHLRLPATSVDTDSRGNLYMLGPVALLLFGFYPPLISRFGEYPSDNNILPSRLLVPFCV